MKQKWLVTIILSLILSCLSAITYAAETYTIDPEHSYVLWQINHLGFSTQAGKWYASGTLVLDKEKPQNSKVDVTINVADMVTGLPELDKHLKGKLFFNTDEFPKATFVSDKVTLTGKKSAKIHGILTVHGVSKPVTLNVKLNQDAVNPLTESPTVGFTGNTTIKRSDFGMMTLLPKLGDEVKIDINVEASQPKK